MAVKSDLEALILGALKEGALHGYGILKVIKDEGDLVKAGEGQLYPVLHRMEDQGLIEGVWEPQEGRPPRRVYSLTDKGTVELDRQRAEFRRKSGAIARVLGLKPEGA
ncbi:MAG: helix-turn-helix transcriptional regulator [Armatimonadota bacterium]